MKMAASEIAQKISDKKRLWNSFIEKVKDKKELRGLDSNFVCYVLGKYLKKDASSLSEKKQKEIIKKTRAILREVHGAFISGAYHKRWKFLENLLGLDDTEGHRKILSLHRSAKERLEDYPLAYKNIFSFAGKPKTVLDLGCGLNPLSIPFMPLTKTDLDKLEYYAVDISVDDAAFIQEYFDKVGLKGKAPVLNLLEIEELEKLLKSLPRIDICFMFKLLDNLETLEPDISKKILEVLKKFKINWLAASFPTRTLGGRKRLSRKRLVWFEKLLHGLKFWTFEIRDEVFYVVKLVE